MKTAFVIHPFLFSTFPVLALYSANMNELQLTVILLPLVMSFGSVSILMFLSWVIVRDIKRAGIVVSLFLALFFSYGTVLVYITGSNFEEFLVGLYWLYLSIIWAVIFVICTYLVLRTRWDLRNLTNIINVIAITMILISLARIGIHELKRPTFAWDGNTEVSELTSGNMTTQRDIYYLIVDAYGSTNILKEFYDFGNREFLDYLSGNGFYIASQSVYNFCGSYNSIASALNMEYLNFLRDQLGQTNDILPVYKMLEDHRVGHFLKLRGYDYIHIGSRWDMTAINRNADININYAPNPEFYRFLYRATLAYPFTAKFNLFYEERQLHYEFALYQFENLMKIPNRTTNYGRPIFVFAHIIVPHMPVVFDQDGSFLTIEQIRQRTSSENYLNQLIFVNKKLEALIDEILSKSTIPPIIVIQGDHGPTGGWALSDYDALSSEEKLRVGKGILNAYYLPAGGQDLLYDSITPINTFRLVFDYYFGTNYGLLSDRSYFVGSPYQFFDVTASAQGD